MHTYSHPLFSHGQPWWHVLRYMNGAKKAPPIRAGRMSGSACSLRDVLEELFGRGNKAVAQSLANLFDTATFVQHLPCKACPESTGSVMFGFHACGSCEGLRLPVESCCIESFTVLVSTKEG
jgi:hypothetical protein